jgi:argininosuccinate lyase
MAKKLWGGRFKKEVDKDFFEFQKSIQYDYKLAEYDIYHSIIHVIALKKSGILTKDEADRLIKALNDIFKEVLKGTFKPDLTAEDIHTQIQDRVEKKVGKLVLKLHTLRSRNDQVVFDEKWYCYKEAVTILSLLNLLSSALNKLSTKYKGCFLPGYTHMQRAQVVSFSNYVGAYFGMFSRDFDRLDNFVKNLAIYVGSGALAGSAIPKEAYNKAIKQFLDSVRAKSFAKSEIVKNSIDNVSSRDFIVEFLSVISMIQMHLSRMAEDFIIYSTREFNFFDLPEEFCTGSSLMPHKKNPDLLELVRGYTGHIYGNLVAILTTMKGLPLTYNRDMQLDKEPLFSSVQIITQELKLMIEFVKGLKLNNKAIEQALEDENLYATELAEYLVYKGVPFKEAHTVIGQLVRYAQDHNVSIKTMPDKTLHRFHKQLSHKDISKLMNPKSAVASKKSLSASKAKPLASKRKKR